MNEICDYLGHQTLIDWCKETKGSHLALAIGGTLLSVGALVKIYQIAHPKIRASHGQAPHVQSLQQRVDHQKASGIVHPIDSNNLIDTKLYFEEIHRYFIQERDANQAPSNNFKDSWRVKFDSFEDHIKERLIKEDLRNRAIAKGFKGDNMAAFISFASEEIKKQSIEFVRNLKTVIDPSGKVLNPLQAVPAMLLRICDTLQSEITRDPNSKICALTTVIRIWEKRSATKEEKVAAWAMLSRIFPNQREEIVSAYVKSCKDSMKPKDWNEAKERSVTQAFEARFNQFDHTLLLSYIEYLQIWST